MIDNFIHRFGKLALAWLLVITAACSSVRESAFQEPHKAALRTSFSIPAFKDDLPVESLSAAVKRNIAYLDKLPHEHRFSYGDITFTPARIKESQELLLNLLEKYPDPEELKKNILSNFEIFKASGTRQTGKVLFTGYYEPLYEASLEPDQTYKYPIYSPPKDMIKIDLGLFDPRFEGEYLTARIDGSKAVPYHSRNEIENGGVLKGRGLEIAWLKSPVDVAFLHIQGSGRLKLPDGRIISAGYAAKNGHPYRSIGARLIEQGLLSREGMSMQAIRGYLAAHPGKVNELLDHNPSYVFFRLHYGPAVGNIGVPLTPQRSIALDADLFPKGALCFISTKKPRVDTNGRIVSWAPFSTFVINQDTGAAIKGGGRADIFWGFGEYAEIAAGHLKHQGELYLLVKKH